METVTKNKTRVLKTKKGVLSGAKSENFIIVEHNGKKFRLETPTVEEIEARRNPAYKYLV